MIALGVFVFIGLKITGIDMRATAEKFYNKSNLADITITSTLGIDKFDRKEIEKINNISSYEYGYYKDVKENGSNRSFRLMSNSNLISKYQVISGIIPKNNHQIAIDYRLMDKYKIGDIVDFEDTKSENIKLKNNRYEVVGFVKLSEYIDSKNIGTGNLYGYGVLTKDSFISSRYSIAMVRFKDMENLSSYRNKYKNKVKQYKKDIEDILGEHKTEFKKYSVNDREKVRDIVRIEKIKKK